MITGDIRSKVDRIWDDFWSGGISNPLTVVEQITYLLFIKRLDEIHTGKELKANADKLPVQDPVFPADSTHLRWSRFKDMEAGDDALKYHFNNDMFYGNDFDITMQRIGAMNMLLHLCFRPVTYFIKIRFFLNHGK